MPGSNLFPPLAVKETVMYKEHFVHVHKEAYRFMGKEITSAWIDRQLQAFYRNSRNPLEFVLIEEIEVSIYYPWEHKFVFKWVNLGK